MDHRKEKRPRQPVLNAEMAETILLCQKLFPWRISTGLAPEVITEALRKSRWVVLEQKPQDNGWKRMCRIRSLVCSAALAQNIYTLTTTMLNWRQDCLKRIVQKPMYQLSEKTISLFLETSNQIAKRVCEAGLENDPDIRKFLDALRNLQDEVINHVSGKPVLPPLV
jgi:hypothetical protein